MSPSLPLLAPPVENNKAAERELLKKFRAKVSPHLGSIIRKSDAVARQFLPDVRELENFGTETPFEEGRDNRGIYGLERIYEDRAVLTPYFECAAYCRYCFKKTRTLGGSAKRMSDENIDAALAYISADARIKTILITGGDPFIDTRLLKKVLDKVVQVPHVRNIRVGTRNILFKPDCVTDELADMLASYNRVDYANLSQSKNLSVGLSLNHADEITPEVARATRRLIERGIIVRGQIVLLKGINDNVASIKGLLDLFLCLGIVPYYLFHCMPVVGTKHLRTSVYKGVRLLKQIAEFSGSTAPLYVYVTPIGKHRVGLNEKLDYVILDGKRYLRAKTPYQAKKFFEFADKTTLPPLHEVDANGYVTSHYLDGDDEGGLS